MSILWCITQNMDTHRISYLDHFGCHFPSVVKKASTELDKNVWKGRQKHECMGISTIPKNNPLSIVSNGGLLLAPDNVDVLTSVSHCPKVWKHKILNEPSWAIFVYFAQLSCLYIVTKQIVMMILFFCEGTIGARGLYLANSEYSIRLAWMMRAYGSAR